jgi:hypothetical protein
MDEHEPLRWRDCITAKWVIFAGGVAFLVVVLGQQDGWSMGQTIAVLTIAWGSALMAVGLDRVE